MNMKDVLRFDELHLRVSKGEVLDRPTQIEYEVLLERVVPGKDGQSEFPLGDATGIFSKQAKALACRQFAEDLCKQALAHGPEVVALLRALLAR